MAPAATPQLGGTLQGTAAAADRAGRNACRTTRLASAAKGTGKASAFQRGLAALTQYIQREGAHKAVPRGHVERVVIDGEEHQHKLGVWISNTKTRRDKLTEEQLDALRELGIQWA
jgi:hypothetical protein